MPYISITYELPLPNDFLVDHSQSEGKTRTATYNGPDKLYLYIGEDGTEKHGPVTEEDLADGRPCPADSTLFEIDCTEHPLICQLRGPVINDLQEQRTGEVVPHPQSPVIEGFPQFTYQLPLIPDDIYNRWSVKIVNGEPTIHAWTATEKLLDKEDPLTWDDIRKHRDTMLSNSDSQLAIDMPEELQDVWKAYRQKLRDLPAIMQANNVPPSIAYYMFPNIPNSDPPV
jgi:hypothetical protein